MVSPRARAIGREALLATVAWSVIYCFAFVCLVFYKWQTRDYYLEEQQQLLAAQGIEPEIVVKKIRKEIIQRIPKKSEDPLEDLNQQQETLKSVLSQFQSQKDSNGPTLSRLTEQLEVLQKLFNKVTDLNLNAKDLSSSLLVPESNHIDKLLLVPALSNLETTEALESGFTGALDQLNKMVEQQDEVNWKAVQNAFHIHDYPPKEPSDANRNCPTESQTISPSAARISDLKQRLHKIDVLLDQRVPGAELPSTIMPDTMMALKRTTDGVIHELFLEIIAQANSEERTSNNASSCVDIEHVLEIVEEGLLVLHRHEDLRSALQQKIVQLDPKAKDIILDADFPMMQPTIPERDTINLRRILDTALMTKIANWIDQLVEIGGGHNDALDHFLDSFAGRESVGEKLVRLLFETSGRVEIPHPQKVLQKLHPEVDRILKGAGRA